MKQPIAVGIDLVSVARVERMLGRNGSRVLARLLTEGERSYVETQAVPARHVAARIAAKEAVYKALQGDQEARGIGWQEIEVARDWDGRPAVQLSGRAERRAAALGVSAILLSLTHSDETAAAMVVLVA